MRSKIGIDNRQDIKRKLNVHETFRRRPELLLNVLCKLDLRPVYRS